MRRQFIVIHNIASPYRVHLFTELWKALKQRGVDFHVHFMSKEMGKGRPLFWRDQELPFPHTYWRDFGFKSYHFNPGLIGHLCCGCPPDFLLLGSGFDSFTGLLTTALVPRKKSILWTESNTITPGVTTGIRGAVKQYVFLHHDYISVPPGVEGRKYVELYQAFSKKPFPSMVPLPNLVDERRFADVQNRAEVRERIRKELGVASEDRMAICPARLEPCKGLLEFFRSIDPNSLRAWTFAVIGEGRLRPMLSALLLERGLHERVVLKKFVSYGKMPELYAAADLFVLPSLDDQNPLSVVEALHSGLPVLLSKRVGNYAEAVCERVTGWGFSPLDEKDVERVTAIAFRTSGADLKKMGAAAQRLARQSWNTELSIQRFLDALGMAVQEQ